MNGQLFRGKKKKNVGLRDDGFPSKTDNKGFKSNIKTK